jgi:predicted porin
MPLASPLSIPTRHSAIPARLGLAIVASLVTATACAQSATLFGVLDVNLRSVSNGSAGTVRSESSDGLNTSRLGIRGQEDLGDGLKAAFWLESAILPDTGTTNAKFWNRRATVALVDPRWGELRLGRDNMPTFNALGAYDPFGTNGLGAVIGNGTGTGPVSLLGSGASTLTRSDNQVSYFLPGGLAGIYGQLAVAPGEGTIGNHQTSGRIGYAGGPVNVSISYAQTDVSAGDKYKQSVIGGSYDLGWAKAALTRVESRYDSAVGGPRKQTLYQLGATVPLGSGEIHLGYIDANMSGGAAGSGYGDGDDARQYALSYLYKLSKRTAVYGTAARLSNSGGSRLVLSAGNPGMLGGESSSGYEVGIRHNF